MIVIYGLEDDRFTVDTLFNLFCQYGNPLKVKVMQKKGKMAMIQFMENRHADIAIRCMDKAVVFGKEISVQLSKHSFIADARVPLKVLATRDDGFGGLLRLGGVTSGLTDCVDCCDL